MDWINVFSNTIFLLFLVGIPVYGAYRHLDVFDTFVTGAKGGFQTAIQIMPYLIGLMTAIGMLRASGFFELLSKLIGGALDVIGMPHELLPLALIRPFSGSASNGILAELSHQYGGDSFIAKTAATIMGSTETTFFVIAVYFGSIGIRQTRHAIIAGLLADLSGIIAAVMICKWLFL
jgi:spore maturation protein B